jgi:ribose transport system permease protein
MSEKVESLDVLDVDEEGTSNLQSSVIRILGSWRLAGIAIPCVILFVSLSIWVGQFLTKTNLINILDQQSAYLAIAAAGTLVLVAGGLDLSVGAIYGLAAVVSGQLAEHHSPVIAIGAGLLVGLGMGLANGMIVAFLKINPFIATLAMSFVISGVALKASGNNLIVL